MNATEHTAVRAYLTELEQLLADAPKTERAEVLSGVRDHVAAALEPVADPTDDDVHEVLDRLGPPEDVAREALGHPPGAARRRPWHDRWWVPVVVLLLHVVALALGVLVGVGAFSWTTITAVESTDGQILTRTGEYHLWQLPLAPFVALLAGGLPWLVLLALVVPSRLWTRREKLVHALVLPVSALVVAAAPAVGWLLTREGGGIDAGLWAGAALVVVGAGVTLMVLTRPALARTRSRDR